MRTRNIRARPQATGPHPEQQQPLLTWPLRRAILAPNHLSILDGWVVTVAWQKFNAGRTRQPLLFGVDPDYSRHPAWERVLRGACRIWQADFVPIGRGASFGLRRMLRHLDQGGVVCLFPSGAIGAHDRFPGIEFLSQRSGAPIHDVHLEYRIGRGRHALTRVERVERAKAR